MDGVFEYLQLTTGLKSLSEIKLMDRHDLNEQSQLVTKILTHLRNLEEKHRDEPQLDDSGEILQQLEHLPPVFVDHYLQYDKILDMAFRRIILIENGICTRYVQCFYCRLKIL